MLSTSTKCLSAGDQSEPFYNVVFVLGGPGSGKGTQCAKIEKEFGFVHLSAGELLRFEIQRKDSEFGSLIDTYIRDGQIVPVEITCKLLENAMLAKNNAVGYLIDGFPRNWDNVNGWLREMSSKVHLHFVLYINTPVDVCLERCLHRSQNRTDDNKESMAKRITTYKTQTLPIIQHYSSLKLVREIDGSGNEDEVYQSVKKIFENANFRVSNAKET